MAVPVVASSSNFVDAATGATTRTCPVPTGTVSGDWLLMVVVCRNVTTASTVTTPTGWTLRDTRNDPSLAGGTPTNQYIFTRKADGTEGSTITVDSTAGYRVIGICVRVTGADSTDCVDVIAYGAKMSGDATGSVPCGGVWAAYNDSLALVFGMTGTGRAAYDAAYPTGFTNVNYTLATSASTGLSIAAWRADVATQGYIAPVYARATDSITPTNAYGNVTYGYLVIIRSTSGAITYPAAPVVRSYDLMRISGASAAPMPKPHNTANGDVLVSIVNTTTNGKQANIAGFTSVYNATSGTTTQQAQWRKVDGSEGASFVPWTTTSASAAAALLRIANVDGFDVGSSQTGTSTSPTHSGITTTVDDALVLATQSSAAAVTTQDSGYPSGYVGLTNRSGLLGTAIASQAAAGATGAVTWSGATASGAYVAGLIAFSPSSGGGGGSSGAATGTALATVVGTGRANARAVSTVGGTAAATATSRVGIKAQASASATVTISATGRSAQRSAATTSGIASVTGTTRSKIRAVVTVAGIATAVATSKTSGSRGAVAGAATVTGLARAANRAVATVNGVATPNAAGAAKRRATGSIVATALAAATSRSGAGSQAIGTAIATVSGVGRRAIRGQFNANGVAIISALTRALKRGRAQVNAQGTAAAIDGSTGVIPTSSYNLASILSITSWYNILTHVITGVNTTLSLYATLNTVLMTDYSTELFQGDSSDTFDVKVFDGTTQVTNLSGYTGQLYVMQRLGDTPLISKAMTVVGSSFQGRLTPTETTTLTPQTYKCVLEIANTTLAFRREHHVELTIRKQGYVS